MLKIGKLFLSFFTGGGAKGLAEEFRLARKDQLEASNDAEKLSADERMHQITNAALAQTSGAATWLPKLVRGLFAAPFIVYLWKLIVWDKVFGIGVTDDLSADLWRIFAIIITFYFLDASIGRFTKR